MKENPISKRIMKSNLTLVAALVALGLSCPAMADKEKSKPTPKLEGKVVVVGKDGEKKEYKIGDDGTIRIPGVDGKPRIELRLGNGTREKLGSSPEKKSAEGKNRSTGGIRLKGYSIGPDGKRRELDFGNGKGLDLKEMMRSRTKGARESNERRSSGEKPRIELRLGDGKGSWKKT